MDKSVDIEGHKSHLERRLDVTIALLRPKNLFPTLPATSTKVCSVGTLSALSTKRGLALPKGFLEAFHTLGSIPFVSSLAAHRTLTLT